MTSLDVNSLVDSDTIELDDISDHRLVNCRFRLVREKRPVIYRSYRDFSTFVYNDFLEGMQLVNWNLILEFNEVDLMVEF